MEQIDEDLIKKASILMGPGNNFETVLSIADSYRAAGLTPLFFLNEEENMIHVTTEEKYYGKYNS